MKHAGLVDDGSRPLADMPTSAVSRKIGSPASEDPHPASPPRK